MADPTRPEPTEPDLPQLFWAAPARARTTMTTKDVRSVLLKYDGQIMAVGKLWRIVPKRIGPGVYEVLLEEWNG